MVRNKSRPRESDAGGCIVLAARGGIRRRVGSNRSVASQRQQQSGDDDRLFSSRRRPHDIGAEIDGRSLEVCPDLGTAEHDRVDD